MKMALEGLLVLETTHAWAGPLCGMYFADMGAEVIHIEKPGVGDLARSAYSHGPLVKGENLPFLFFNRNKKGITLDLNLPKGQEVFKQLIPKADILIENFIPGTMDKWNVGYKELKKINPGLIMVSISGFGQTGPYKHYPGFDLIAQGISGLMSVTGYPDSPPVKAGNAIADYLGATYGFCGAMTALYWKQKTGQGQYVDVGLMDSTVFTLGDRIVRYAMVKEPELISRVGNRYPMMGRARCIATKDGFFTIRATTQKAVYELAKLLGRDIPTVESNDTSSLIEAMQFESMIGDELGKFLKDKTNKEAMELMEGLGVACSPVQTISEVMNDPQFHNREMLVDVEHPVLGTMQMVGIVPKLSETPGKIRTAGPALGEHNKEVYAKLMGYTEKDLDALKEEGVV